MGGQVGRICQRTIETKDKQGREKKRGVGVVVALEIEVAQQRIVDQAGGLPGRLIDGRVESVDGGLKLGGEGANVLPRGEKNTVLDCQCDWGGGGGVA